MAWLTWTRLCVTDKGLTRSENRELNKYSADRGVREIEIKTWRETEVMKCCELGESQRFSGYKEGQQGTIIIKCFAVKNNISYKSGISRGQSIRGESAAD